MLLLVWVMLLGRHQHTPPCLACAQLPACQVGGGHEDVTHEVDGPHLQVNVVNDRFQGQDYLSHIALQAARNTVKPQYNIQYSTRQFYLLLHPIISKKL